MRVLRSCEEMLQASRRQQRAPGVCIGLVPTMGYLHAGHISLVRLAQEQCDQVIVSLFVNPTQFGPQEDFAQYPRDEARDLALCEQAGVDVVFCPTPEDMYAPDASVCIEEERLSRDLCGAIRPGHFKGVCTVVAKLLHLVQPDVAVFGQKDAQQLAVIRRMVRDLFFPVTVVAGPIVREPDGLAMSSRNVYLSVDERREALGLYHCLNRAQVRVRAGCVQAERLEGELRAFLREQYPGVTLEYLAFRDPDTLAVREQLVAGTLVALAARVGRTRLIDNVLLDV